MMVEQVAQGAALHWLPAAEAGGQELQPPLEGVPEVLDWLAAQHFDGALVLHSSPYELVLLLLDGAPIGASLRSTVGGQVLVGPDAPRALVERAGAAARSAARLLPFPRPLAETLSAALDPQPLVRPLEGTEQLRAALRDVAARNHHGVVDLIVGERWGRTLFHHGRLLGAYHYDNPVVAPSLAALGRLATAGPGTLVVRRVPLRPPTPVPWPLAARPAAAPGGPGSDNGARPAAVEQRAIDPVRDEQIESNLLWLLSHVDKDRDRAAQSPEPAPRVLQVLGSFTNAMFAFATHLAPTSRQRVVVPRQADVIAMLRPRHPLLAELELRKDEIDAPALVRRYKALARDAAYAADFYRGMVRGLLALTQHAATLVLGEIGDPAVRARCAAALEVWVASVEGALQEAPSAER